MTKLAFTFVPDGTAHDDLRLTIGDRERVCDSYYLALDPKLDDQREDDDKARRVLCLLLQQWHDVAAMMTEGHPVYLPYDYSDQSTGCLQIVRSGEDVEVRVGYSAAREGHSTKPTDISDYVNSITDFSPEPGASLQMPLEEFLSCIRNSIEREEEKNPHP